MSLADKAEGRTISISYEVHLVPPEGRELGECEAAFEVGEALIRQAALAIRGVGEAEGFTVRVLGCIRSVY